MMSLLVLKVLRFEKENIFEKFKVLNELDVVQLCETQKVRLFHVIVGLMGLCW